MYETAAPLIVRFIETESRVQLELANTTDYTLKSVEILTVFLKNEEAVGGGPSQAHVRFDGVKSLQPNEKVVIKHRTWVDGQPATTERDQLQRLTTIEGAPKPYVLDISWENAEGKSRFQRIPVGH
jgi:hypothetical protein